jgi:hypothetical protein
LIKNIPDFIHSIFDTDITKGKYARFLIDCFLNKKFLEEDLIGGVDSTIGQAISLFHKHKNKLPKDMRSVFKYNSPGDLWNSVKQFQGELSGKELKREEQEQVYRETEFIYKDEETGFQIISPLTKKSAQWWGKGTRWCTSADNDNMFNTYAKHAPLLILLMPASAGNSGNGQKLQLWKCRFDDIQFMDEADNSISRDYIKEHWNILEPICLWLNDLRLLPKEYITPELCELAIKKNGWALSYVPKEFRDYNLCLEAVKNKGYALIHVLKEFRDYNLCLEAVKKNGLTLEFVPEEYKTPELCELAIKQEISFELPMEKYQETFQEIKLCLQNK